MGNAPINDPKIDAIAQVHARRVLVALAGMSIKEVRQLVDEIETEIGSDETTVPK